MTAGTAEAPPRMTTKDGGDIVAGDVIVFLGRPHLIDMLTPASDRTQAIVDDPTARVAHSGHSWAITVHRGQRLDVMQITDTERPANR